MDAWRQSARWAAQSQLSSELKGWAGLHDNVPDRPSARVALIVLHLLGANWRPWHLKLKLSPSPKGGLRGTSCHPIWDVGASALSCTRLAARTFCHLGGKSAGTLSCNPALATLAARWAERGKLGAQGLVHRPSARTRQHRHLNRLGSRLGSKASGRCTCLMPSSLRTGTGGD